MRAANEMTSAGVRPAGDSADILIRRKAGTGTPMEIRVAVIGNVDSGKSTMVGVLTRSILDDGRGLARSKVFKHGHEEATGRTSSIGQHNLCVSRFSIPLSQASQTIDATKHAIMKHATCALLQAYHL